MAPPQAKWLEYQQLAARIYADLQPHATVTHDDKILGVDSGALRQIDVSIRTSIAGHDILIIVQARDRKRRADVNAVGELAQVMKDVRAAKAVLVSNAGFSKSAFRLAKNSGIDLCALQDAQSPNWPLSISIPLLWVERHAEVEVEFVLHGSSDVKEDVVLPQDAREWLFSVDGGASRYKVFDDFANFWNRDARNREPGALREWRPDCSNLTFRVAPDVWVTVDQYVVRYQPAARGWLGSLRLSDCRGIMNQTTDTLQARGVLKSSEIPVSKDPSWPTIEDPDGFVRGARGLIVVECAELAVDTLRFTKFASGPPNHRLRLTAGAGRVDAGRS